MKKLTFMCTSLFFTLAVMGATSEKIILKTFLEKQEVQQAIQEYLAADNTATKTDAKIGFIDFFNQLNENVNTRTEQSNFKSISDNTHILDSLFVEGWNESTGSLEASQLEKWSWYENGRGESWELYEMDSVTNQWAPNDKEKYDWDKDGNKILHIDYDPDTVNGGWLLNGKEVRSFDSNGNKLSHLLQLINQATAEWENNTSISYTYNANGNKLEELYKNWDTTSNEWVNFEKEILSYDENDGLLKDEYFSWDTAQNEWVSSMFLRYEYDEYGYVSLQELVINEYFIHTLITYTNDSEGNEIQVLSYIWDTMTMSYILIIKNEHTYTADGNALMWAHFTWDEAGNDWQISWKMNYQYDENGYLIYRDRYDLDETLNILIISWNSIYVNNADGNPVFKSSMERQLLSDEWLNNYKEHYTYDSQKRLNYIDRFNWDIISNDWIGDYKETKNYDDSGNFLFHSKQKYDPINNQWVDVFADEYTYDLSIDLSAISYPDSWPFRHLSNLVNYEQYTNAMLQKVYSEMRNDQLETTKKYTFYYSANTTTALTEPEDRRMIVFPNPATDFVEFEIDNISIPSSVELYDLQGRKVISKLLPSNNQLSISHLIRGVYVYKLIQGSEVKQGKIIKN